LQNGKIIQNRLKTKILVIFSCYHINFLRFFFEEPLKKGGGKHYYKLESKYKKSIKFVEVMVQNQKKMSDFKWNSSPINGQQHKSFLYGSLKIKNHLSSVLDLKIKFWIDVQERQSYRISVQSSSSRHCLRLEKNYRKKNVQIWLGSFYQ
jgi:hypothetical protein